MSGAGDEDMRNDLEVAIVRACCNSCEQEELFWIFSRSQLEFVLKDLDLVNSSKSIEMAKYQDLSLPVIFLEKHYGYVGKVPIENAKYMVLCSVDEEKKVRRMIVQSGDAPKFFKLTRSFAALDTFSVPENSEHVLGAYSLGKGKIGIVPDLVGIIEGIV